MGIRNPLDSVQWIGPATWATEAHAVLYDVVVRRGVSSFEAVYEAVADELLNRDRRRVRGGAELDVLRLSYLAAARRFLDVEDGVSIRIAGAEDAASARGGDGSALPRHWYRAIGRWIAIGAALASLQHVTQRLVFQHRPLDVHSALILAAYLAVGVIGLAMFRDHAPSTAMPTPPRRSP